MEHTVWGHGAAGGRGEYPGTAPHFLFLLIQNVYRILCQKQGAVGVFCFQGCFHHLAVDSCYLPFNPEVASFQIKVIPFQPQKFSPPQTGGQFHVAEGLLFLVHRAPQHFLSLMIKRVRASTRKLRRLTLAASQTLCLPTPDGVQNRSSQPVADNSQGGDPRFNELRSQISY